MKIDLGDQSLVKIVIGTNIRHHRADQIVDISAQPVEIHDLGKTDDNLPEALDPFCIMLIGLDRDEDADAEVELLGVEQRNPALDVAGVLKLLNPSPARGRTQPDAVCEYRAERYFARRTLVQLALRH